MDLGVTLDVGANTMRWITVGPPGQPDTNIVLQPPVCDPGISQAEAQLIADLMAKGTYAGVNLACDDLDGLFERLAGAEVEVVQEPKNQDYGIRDFVVRDPAGNLIRVQEKG
ncbi:VOC family protein [Ammonicoccus fulvus]|uniref:VOC family protein n=1 Tax=Ammonicoccus fulvus TaxID=3138240 RepID=A0ABZ3FN35_9ACTN